MFKFDYVSARGDILPLTENPYFHLTHVDGQTEADTSIKSAVIGGVDGDTVNNVQATARTIVLDLRIRSGVDVEEAKRAILKIVKLKQRGMLVWTQNARTVNIAGIVEAVEMPRWSNATVMQITLHCEQPFWEDVDDIITQIDEALNAHCFPLYFTEEGMLFGQYGAIRTKSLHNDGDVAVGLEITIVAYETVTNPIIYDQNGNFFGLGYEYETADAGAGIGTAWVSAPFVMKAGDVVVITTHKGNKTVKYNGVPIYGKIKPQSTWLQLEAGDNKFTIDSDDDSATNMSFSLVYRQRYI